MFNLARLIQRVFKASTLCISHGAKLGRTHCTCEVQAVHRGGRRGNKATQSKVQAVHQQEVRGSNQLAFQKGTKASEGVLWAHRGKFAKPMFKYARFRVFGFAAMMSHRASPLPPRQRERERESASVRNMRCGSSVVHIEGLRKG